MTNQQEAPEALRLAEQYDHGDPAAHGNAWKVAVCNELRRLYAENKRLAALVEAEQPADCGNTPYDEGPFTLAQQPSPSAAAEWLEHAFREGWSACRDAEFVGEEAEDWAFGSSQANGRMIGIQQAAPQPSPTAQADSQPASQGETNAQLDIDSNPPAPRQQRDVAGSVALGQPVGNGPDQAAGHTGAQGDKLLTVAERNIRSFLRSATFKSESDREAALSCVDVLWAAARAPADSVLEDAARLLRQILAASQDGDSDTHLSAHFVSRIETITKAGGAA